MKIKNTDIKWREPRRLYQDNYTGSPVVTYFRGQFKFDIVIGINSVLVSDDTNQTIVLNKECYGKKPAYRWAYSSEGILIEVYPPHATVVC